MPEGSYTTSLFQGGIGRIAQKVIEEAGEVAIAAAESKPEEIPPEVADLLYHTLVLMSAAGVTPSQVWGKLQERRK
jgi:phosphoribosyl-ATP pyrophosphohydrolase/phosphoribosyl-AMP cyclohydrolase